MSTIFLTSQRNAMKRDESSGSTNMAAPKTGAYSNTVFVTNLPPISHNLGKVPVFRYYYEPFGDGIIWPPLTDRFIGQATNPLNTAQIGPGIVAWADTNNLYLQLFFSDTSLTGTYPVYWVIYKDYAV